MSDPILVSLHIPKTAGITLLHILLSIYGERLQRAYQPPKKGITPSETDGWPDITNPACIHGHGVIRRFPWVLDVPDARWITFLREPLARAVSMYRFRQQYRPWDGSSSRQSPENSFNNYLLEEHNHNAYAQWFDKCKRVPEAFFFIGITERFDDSITVLSQMIGWQKVQYNSRNQSPGQSPDVQEEIIEHFRSLNSEDYAIYAEQKEIFESRWDDHSLH